MYVCMRGFLLVRVFYNNASNTTAAGGPQTPHQRTPPSDSREGSTVAPEEPWSCLEHEEGQQYGAQESVRASGT